MSNVTRMPSANWSQSSWPQAWPPNCSCGCNPCQCGGGWGGMDGLMQCWQDIAQFQQFLACMLSQMGPVPLQGVTDGSNAKPGYIGEFLTATSTMAYAAYPANTVNTISLIVLPPGDWNMRVWCQYSSPIGTGLIVLSPTPAGVSNDMGQGIETGASGSSETILIGKTARGNFTVPTLMPFQVTANQSTVSTLLAGTATISLEARRIR